MVFFVLPFPYRSLIFTPNYQLFMPLSFFRIFFKPIISHVRASGGCLCPLSVCSMRAFHDKYREGNVRLGNKQKIFARVCAKLLWRVIYCTNNIPKPDPQSGSMFCRRLGRKSPWIIKEKNLATKIEIRLLIHPHMWEMGSSILSFFSSGLRI